MGPFPLLFLSLFLVMSPSALGLDPITTMLAGRIVRIGWNVEKALWRDQIEAVTTAIAGARELACIASPLVRAGSLIAGDTLARLVSRITRKISRRWKGRKMIQEGMAIIEEGGGKAAAMQLYSWLHQNKGTLKDHPLVALSILEKAIDSSSHLFLDMLIMHTRHCFTDDPLLQQLYSAQLIRSEVSVRYLRKTLGKDAFKRISPGWWVHEFMSRIVTFPRDKFIEYLSFFFQVHPAADENKPMQLLQQNPPPIAPDLPPETKEHLSLLSQLRYFHVIQDVSLLRRETKPVISAAHLEFFLNLSKIMAKVRKAPEKYSPLLSWISANYPVNRAIVQNDYHRITKAALALEPRLFDRAELKNEVINSCACKIYATLRTCNLIPAPLNDCPCFKEVEESLKMIRRRRIKARCADMAIDLEEVSLFKLEPASQYWPIVGGMIFERLLDLDSDQFRPSREGSLHDSLNISLTDYCAGRQMWPMVAFNRRKSATMPFTVGPSKADIDIEQMGGTVARKGVHLRTNIFDLLNRDDDPQTLKEILEEDSGSKLKFAEYRVLINQAARLGQNNSLIVLIEKAIDDYGSTQARRISQVLADLRKTHPKLRSLLRPYNNQTLGLIKGK